MWPVTVAYMYLLSPSMPNGVSVQSGEEQIRPGRTSTHRAVKDCIGKWEHSSKSHYSIQGRYEEAREYHAHKGKGRFWIR